MNTIASSSSANASTFGSSDQVLRWGLRLDAAVSGAFGLALLAGGGLMTGLLGISAMFLWAVGGVCLAYAAVLWVVQSRSPVRPAIGWTIVVANGAWVVVSVALVAADWLPLTLLGTGFVLLQALVVGGLAYLQWVGLRRTA